MPGMVLILMVNDPSLNGGKKLRPKLQNITNATTKRAIVDDRTTFL